MVELLSGNLVFELIDHLNLTVVSFFVSVGNLLVLVLSRLAHRTPLPADLLHNVRRFGVGILFQQVLSLLGLKCLPL